MEELGKLDISHQGLTTLEGINLTGVITLNCSSNYLTSLPATLPPTLEYLWCSDNLLTSLPKLPPNLKRLWCCNNRLKVLPPLPLTLKILWCRDNQLTSLPDLPRYLSNLWASGNPCCFTNNEYYINTIKLQEHNEKREKLGLQSVDMFPSKEEWDNIDQRYTIFRYEPGGDMFEQAQQEIKNLLAEN